MANLFDSPWKVLLVAVVLIVLFGSKKLPDAARSLGKSMRILKTEVSDMHQDEDGVPAKPAAQVPQAQLAPAPVPAPADQQGQIDALLSSKPSERRSLFEETAGIGRFLARKAEAMRARKRDRGRDR